MRSAARLRAAEFGSRLDPRAARTSVNASSLSLRATMHRSGHVWPTDRAFDGRVSIFRPRRPTLANGGFIMRKQDALMIVVCLFGVVTSSAKPAHAQTGCCE